MIIVGWSLKYPSTLKYCMKNRKPEIIEPAINLKMEECEENIHF